MIILIGDKMTSISGITLSPNAGKWVVHIDGAWSQPVTRQFDNFSEADQWALGLAKHFGLKYTVYTARGSMIEVTNSEV